MLILLLLALLGTHGSAAPHGLGSSVGEPVDSLEIYSALLQKIRGAYPGFPVLLAETRSGVACMPHCGATYRGRPVDERSTNAVEPQDHSPELLRRLLDRGLVQATCVVPERTFGCLGRRGQIFVGLGEIQASPPGGPRPVEGGVWVKVVLLLPCTVDCRPREPGEPYFPDGFGLWFLLKPHGDATWEVVTTEPAFSL